MECIQRDRMTDMVARYHQRNEKQRKQEREQEKIKSASQKVDNV